MEIHMRKTLFAFAAVAALGAAGTTVAADTAAMSAFDQGKQLITELQKDKRAVMLATLPLTEEQRAKFTPIYDEYQAEKDKQMTEVYKLSNRLFVADYGGMTDEESKEIMKQAFDLREDRVKLLRKYAEKLDKELPSTKVAQFVQIENKMTALLDVAAAASVPIVTKTTGVAK
jgi:Spy/CpxP family protein refolding chaperone